MTKTKINKAVTLSALFSLAIQLITAPYLSASSATIKPGEASAIRDAAVSFYQKGYLFINDKNKVLTPLDLLSLKSTSKVYVVPPKNDPRFEPGSQRQFAYLVSFERSQETNKVIISIEAYDRNDLVTPVSFRSLELVIPTTKEESASQTLALQQAIVSLEFELCGCEADSTQKKNNEEIANLAKTRINLLTSAMMMVGALTFLAGATVAGFSQIGARNWFGRLLMIGGLAVFIGGGIKIYANETSN